MRRTMISALAVVTGVLGLLGTLTPGAQAVDSPQGRLVASAPAAGTPHVLNGAVSSIAQVGNQMILGGSFTTARNDDSQTQLTRDRLLSFNADTGQISTTFLPNPNGSISTVIPAGDGVSVYVAGAFSSIGGVARTNVARVRVSDGAVITAFDAGSVTGRVKDLRLAGGRLWLAGMFTHVEGHAQRGLATVNPSTGAFDPFMGLTIAGVHNGGYTGLGKIDVSPDGSRLVGIGNFDTLDGVKNRQLFMLDLDGADAAPSLFQTKFYETPCNRVFDSYMRDLDFSPDGSFFAITTTGAYGGSGVACDTTARFETAATGTDVQPSWVDYTGGDTTYAVEITDSVVYTGGHARWQNNPFAGDRAGPGAVSRPGIAALDPLNGLPLSWNPTRTRGVGVFDFLVNSRGLWVGSDTDRIGSYVYKGRIALMPLDGAVIPAVKAPTLPNDIYVGARQLPAPESTITRRSYNAGTVGASSAVPNGGIDWNQVRGAFMVNGQVYVASNNGAFTRRTFNASTYGAPVAVDTHDELNPLVDWRSDIAASTGMFFDSGRIYFTRSDSNQLFYRYFTPENDVVGAKRFVASGNVAGIDFAQVRGMFTTGTKLFWAKPNGSLNQMDWQDGALSDTPVGGTATQVSGPGVDTNLWAARTLFLYQDQNGNGAAPVGNRPPTASFTASCSQLSCSFDSSGSADPDGDALTYSWDFGDGATATGPSPSHNYGSAGQRTVTLSLSDGTASDSTTRQVEPTVATQAQLEFVDAASTSGNRSNHSVVMPSTVRAGDTLVLFLTTNSTNSTVNNAVAGWTLLESQDGNKVRGRAWTRTATASDAGAEVTVTTTGLTKSTLAVSAYRGTGGAASAVSDSTSSVVNSAATSHTTPAVPVTGQGSWLVSAWSEKSSGGTTWSAPAGTPVRTDATGSGSGKVSSILGDSNGPVATGTAPGRTATTSTSVGRTVMFSVVVAPQDGGAPANRPPTASFTASCSQLSCSFDSSGSADPDGDALTYSWDFGDGATATGPSPSHNYGSAGQRTVTLSLSDGTASDSTTRQVEPTVATQAQLEFVDAASTSGNRSNHSVVMPSTVRAGDTLVLFLTTNSTNSTVNNAVAGWTLLESQDGNKVRGRAWTRTATASDAGAEVTVTTTGLTKSTLAVSAYRGTGGAASAVSDSTSSVVNSAATSHTTPAVPVTGQGSWLVSAWSEKSSGGTTWSAPAGTPVRTDATGSGSGKVSSILGDSNGPVATGTAPGRTATTSTSVGRTVMFSVVVTPE